MKVKKNKTKIRQNLIKKKFIQEIFIKHYILTSLYKQARVVLKDNLEVMCKSNIKNLVVLCELGKNSK